jgi:hypothetical protein
MDRQNCDPTISLPSVRIFPEADDHGWIAAALPRLVALDRQQFASVVLAVPGGADNVQDIYPLSPLQEGMLFHHLLKGQGDTYVLSKLF